MYPFRESEGMNPPPSKITLSELISHADEPIRRFL